MSAPNNGGYKSLCPACGSRMRIRGSETLTPTYKSMYGQCTNMGCGGIYSGSLTWDFSLNTPGVEQPIVQLPLAPSAVRRAAFKVSRPDTTQMDMLDAMVG